MTPAPRRRTGFTLVELLVVITIIGILVGLLIPVVWSAVGRANDARVAADVNTLGQALTSFQAKYQEFPPSRIILSESGGYSVANPPAAFYRGMTYNVAYPNIGGDTAMALFPMAGGGPPDAQPASDVTYAALAQRSMEYLRKFFPKVQVSSGGPAPGITPANFYDFNGNGVFDAAPILLQGHECLVFFLGGIPIHEAVGSTYTLNGMGGFSANPRNPFRRPSAASGSDPRVGPFFDFQADRLIDDDLDGIPGYVDTYGTLTQARYFAYFSSYNGSGYDPNDVNFSGSAIGEQPPIVRAFSLNFPVQTSGGPGRATVSPLPNPYTSSLPVAVGDGAATFHQAQSYQIISAGKDRLYGAGGQYTQRTESNRLPNTPPDLYDLIPGNNAPDPPVDTRGGERDNITNFSNGPLD